MKPLQRATILFVCLGTFTAGAIVLGHHSFGAEYDPEKLVNLKGVVLRLELTNPHSHCFIDVKETDGSVTHWELEMGSPGVLTQNGWTRTTLSAGDLISVHAALARNGTKKASARVVTLANGQRLVASSPSDGGPE